MTKIHLIAMAMLLAGCASAPKPHIIHVDSDPQGAHVFVSFGADERSAKTRDYIGTTPCEWDAPLKDDGSLKLPSVIVYSIFVPGVAIITAEPPTGATNLFIQRQIVHGGTAFVGNEKFPKALFFDLRKNGDSTNQH